MVPYPKELRPRGVAAAERGDMTLGEGAPIFSVGVTVVKKRLRLHRAGEDLAPRQGGGAVPKLTAADRRLLQDTVAVAPAVTRAEGQTVLGEQGRRRVSVSTGCRVLQQLELPRKKSLVASERAEKARTKFRQVTEALAGRKYSFIDELGSHLGVTRLSGRAAPGQRVYDEVPGDRGGNVSTSGAIGLAGLRTGLRVPGAIDGETLLFFVEDLLVPTLKRGDIGLLDHNPIHKLDEIEDALEAAGAWGLFLPTSSPALNPIENCWSKVKARVRSLKPRPLPDLLDALTEAFASITLHDLLGWVRPWGYRVAPT